MKFVAKCSASVSLSYQVDVKVCNSFKSFSLLSLENFIKRYGYLFPSKNFYLHCDL